MDDQSLIKAVAAGDNQAFKKLVMLYQQMVANLAFKFVHNAQDAEDIAQDVFFTIWKKAGTFRRESSLSTWIYRITSNRALNFLRKHKHDMQSFSGDELIRKADSDEKKPDNLLEQAENRRIFYMALDKLPEKQRIPFMLNKLEGMSYKQIAENLKLSVANVEARIHRAKKSLQRILIKYME